MLWFGLIVVAALLLVIIVGWGHVSLWIQAKVSGANIGLLDLILMSIKRVDPKVIVRSKIMTAQAGLVNIPVSTLEALYLSGGDVHRVTVALVSASRAGIPLDWDTAAAVDLAGRNVLEAVQSSVIPKVIMCPEPIGDRRAMLSAIARDGIQLKVEVAVTVRTDLGKLIGGATESTVLARVGQGIVAAIGACNSHAEVLANPSLISQQILTRGLDSQTCFSIVSIDIAKIEVGQNIGAMLRVTQADADMRVAEAAAEERRSMAVARQQEMIALKRDFQGRLVLAEAGVMSALAVAFTRGDKPAQGANLRIHPSTG